MGTSPAVVIMVESSTVVFGFAIPTASVSRHHATQMSRLRIVKSLAALRWECSRE